jgi:hypothetical protein
MPSINYVNQNSEKQANDNKIYEELQNIISKRQSNYEESKENLNISIADNRRDIVAYSSFLHGIFCFVLFIDFIVSLAILYQVYLVYCALY